MKLLFALSLRNEIGNDLQHLSSISYGEFLIERFKNQELHITLKSNVQEKTCIILATIAPPDENLFSFLAFSDTLKKNGAKKCIALLPYLAYTRHEHNEFNKSQLTALLGKLLKTCGIDEIITIDIHSQSALSLFPIPIISLSPALIFAKKLNEISFLPNTILAPDKGAIKRAQDVIDALNRPVSLAYIEKKRDAHGILHLNLSGEIGEKIVIIDDILDTGETLLSSTKKLQDLGAKEIVIMVTHGIFSVDIVPSLLNFGVIKIYTTNTTPSHPLVEQLSISSLFQEYLWI